MKRQVLTRREFLQLGSIATGMTAFAACTPTPQGTLSTTTSAPAEEEAQIRFAMWDWYAVVPEVRWDEWNQKEAFPVFEEANPGIKLTWEPLGEGWQDKILTQMAAGTAPDVISTWSPHIETWSEKGQLLDLQPLIEADIPNAGEIFIHSAWEQMWDPFNEIRMGMLSDMDLTSLYYNKSAFQEAGVPLPSVDWTVDDYVAAAQALTQQDDDGEVTRWGSEIRPDFWLGYFYYVEAFGGQVRDEETRMQCLLGEPAAQEGLEWIRHGMWDLNCFAQANQMAATGLPSVSRDALPAGIIAMDETSADRFFLWSENITDFEWDIAHIPKGPKDRACMGVPDEWVIYKGVVERGNQDAAWKVMKWLTGEWYQEKIASVAGRIPGLLTMADQWMTSLRTLDPRLENVRLETVVEQLEMAYPRRAPTFRFQQVAEELINPAMEQIFIEGKAPVSILQDVARKVTEAQQDALARAQS